MRHSLAVMIECGQGRGRGGGRMRVSIHRRSWWSVVIIVAVTSHHHYLNQHDIINMLLL